VSQPCETSGSPLPEGADGVGPDAPKSARPQEHDLKVLLTSGYLDSLGFDYRPATPESTFRDPSKVRAAMRDRR